MSPHPKASVHSQLFNRLSGGINYIYASNLRRGSLNTENTEKPRGFIEMMEMELKNADQLGNILKRDMDLVRFVFTG